MCAVQAGDAGGCCQGELGTRQVHPTYGSDLTLLFRSVQLEGLRAWGTSQSFVAGCSKDILLRKSWAQPAIELSYLDAVSHRER